MPLSDPANVADRLLTLQEAITIALQSIQPIAEMESVPLLRAEGRVLAVDLPACLDIPLGDNSAMDGEPPRVSSKPGAVHPRRARLSQPPHPDGKAYGLSP